MLFFVLGKERLDKMEKLTVLFFGTVRWAVFFDESKIILKISIWNVYNNEKNVRSILAATIDRIPHLYWTSKQKERKKNKFRM